MRLFECQNCGQLLYFENTLCEKWPEHGRAVPHGVGAPSPRGGHYYWDRLVRDGVWLDAFRALFGDERQDYQACLGQHQASMRSTASTTVWASQTFTRSSSRRRSWESCGSSTASCTPVYEVARAFR